MSKAAGLPDWVGLLEVPQRESDVPNSPEMMADLPLLAEYIQVNCYVTRQPTILAGSWEKFTGRWISAGKGGAKTLADRLMERYEQPRPEIGRAHV